MSAIGDGGGADQNVGRRVSPADLIISCQCGAGLCRVEPIPGQADDGGCGFMQWRDSRTNIILATVTMPPPPSTPPRTEIARDSEDDPEDTYPCSAGSSPGLSL